METFHEYSAKRLAAYQLKYRIGKGMFSIVFQAYRGNTMYAMKSIDRELLNNPLVLKATEREIRLHSQLNHPNIVKLHEVIHTPNSIFLVEEFCISGDLDTAIRYHLSQVQVNFYKISKGILDGFAYLESKNLYHRDIKPANIFLDSHYNPKLGDFGLSIQTSDLTTTLCGTPFYCAPEILMNQNYDPAKSDVWSYGALLYQMHYNNLPWISSNLQQTIKKMISCEIPYDATINPMFQEVLDSCLQVNPNNRKSFSELLRLPFFATPVEKSPKKHSASEMILHYNSSPSGLIKQKKTDLHPIRSRYSLHSMEAPFLSA